MAQFPPAFAFSMGFEDSKYAYECVPDSGGLAISGINSLAWPKQFAAIRAIPQKERGRAVTEFYWVQFWSAMQIGGIYSQDVADRVFDEGVNGGAKTAVLLLQESINSIGGGLHIDGVCGALTLDATNAIDPDRIIALYRQARYNHYQAILQKHPEDAPDMKAWDVRALA